MIDVRLMKSEHAQRRCEAGTARGRQHVAGAGHVVAHRLGRVRADEHRARGGDLRRQRARVAQRQLRVLGRQQVDEAHHLVGAVDDEHRALVRQRPGRDCPPRKLGELAGHRLGDLVSERPVPRDQDGDRDLVMLGLGEQIGGDPAPSTLFGDDHPGRPGDERQPPTSPNTRRLAAATQALPGRRSGRRAARSRCRRPSPRSPARRRSRTRGRRRPGARPPASRATSPGVVRRRSRARPRRAPGAAAVDHRTNRVAGLAAPARRCRSRASGYDAAADAARPPRKISSEAWRSRWWNARTRSGGALDRGAHLGTDSRAASFVPLRPPGARARRAGACRTPR